LTYFPINGILVLSREEREVIKMTRIFKNDENDLVCECWGGSTKHPDTVYHFSDFEKSPYVIDIYQVFQWLCEIASKQMFVPHAVEIMDYAYKNWNLWEKTDEEIENLQRRLYNKEKI
jgi:hypothetical protein